MRGTGLARILRAAVLVACAAAVSLPAGALATGVDSDPTFSGEALFASPALLFPPDAEPFGPQRRAFLAQSVLHFVPGEEEPLEEGGAFTVPVPLPWPPGAGGRGAELVVDVGKPVFVLAALTPGKSAFAAPPAVSVDGMVLTGLAPYAVSGIYLSDGREQQEHTALAFVLTGLTLGKHTLNINCGACAPTRGPWLGHVNGGPRSYTLDVRTPPQAAPASPTTPAPAVAATTAGTPEEAIQALYHAAIGDPGDGAASTTPSVTTTSAASSAVSSAPPAPRSVSQEHKLASPALGRSLQYRIYLPAGYEPPAAETASDASAGTAAPAALPAPLKRYPVLYLLHGLGGGIRQWTRFGMEAELDRQAAQMIVVMPAGRAGYWVNHADGGPLWGDYVTQDLISHVDATYRTVPSREARAIGGVSMGGHGALQLALNNPLLFGTVGAHSPALRTRDQAPAFLGGTQLVTSGAGAPPPEAYAARDPISLVTRQQGSLAGAQAARRPALWVDIGESDRWAPRARELEATLRAQKWDFRWSPAPGDHDADYWKRRVPEYVSWYRARLEPAAR